jgi:hypothetical protein
MSKSKSSPETASPDALLFDPTPALCADVLALFAGPLAEVRFPDLDRASLETEATALLRAQHEVEALERSLDLARGRTRDAVAQLTAASQRALAYARVFAMGQPALEEALADVRTSDSPRAEAAPKKRKPRKENGTGDLLSGSDTELESKYVAESTQGLEAHGAEEHPQAAE